MTRLPGTTARRAWVLRVTAAGIGLVLALLLAEVVLRLFGLAAAGGIATVTQADYERLPGIYVPGQKLVDRRNPDLPHAITIDSLGYRGTTAFSREKPDGEIRILMLGDSFTYGDLVDDDKTMPSQLEHWLRTQCGEGIRVINAGIGGTSIDAASDMAVRALPLGIDVAVLTFTENDVSDLAFPMWQQMAANRAAKSKLPLGYVYPVLRRLALWNVALAAQGKWRNWRTSAAVAAPLSPDPTVLSTRLQSLRDAYVARLVNLRNRLAAAQVPLVFAVYPSHLSVYRINSGEQIQWAVRIGLDAGLNTVDYTDVLRRDGRPMEALYLLPRDGHASPAGYSVVVPVLGTALLTVPPLAGRCTVPNNPAAAGSN